MTKTPPAAVAAVLLLATALNAAAAESASARRTPPFAFTIGMLGSFIHTANAYKAECSKHVSAKELDDTVGGWLRRNQPVIDQILVAGRKSNWYAPNQSSEQVWERMWQQDSAQVRAQIAATIAPVPKLMCVDGMRPFKDGSYELENYPVHLKVLGVKV